MCSWMFSGGTGVPMMLTGGIFMLVTWVLVIFAAIYLIRKFVPTRQPHALGILQERFARGEIDANEYRQRRKDLTE
jgi:putative membrane protein